MTTKESIGTSTSMLAPQDWSRAIATPEWHLSAAGIANTQVRVAKLLHVTCVPVDKQVADALSGITVPIVSIDWPKNGSVTVNKSVLIEALESPDPHAHDGMKALRRRAASVLRNNFLSTTVQLIPSVLSITQWKSPWEMLTIDPSWEVIH